MKMKQAAIAILLCASMAACQSQTNSGKAGVSAEINASSMEVISFVQDR